MRNGVFYGLFSALLFGSSTPFAKILLEEVAPILLAGLFYVGSGLGLFLLILTKRFFSKTPFKREKTVALRFDWGGQKIPARDIPSLIGSTINPTTGDYSRGASGFWVEGGEVMYPVNECTIAGKLREMLRSMIAANDVRMHLSTRVPSLLVEGLTLAGE